MEQETLIKIVLIIVTLITISAFIFLLKTLL